MCKTFMLHLSGIETPFSVYNVGDVSILLNHFTHLAFSTKNYLKTFLYHLFIPTYAISWQKYLNRLIFFGAAS